MARKSKKSSEEFKIERIYRSRDETESDYSKQRSLVFRISKMPGKSIENEFEQQETLLATNCSSIVTENNIPDRQLTLNIMSNVEEQTDLKIQQLNENDNKELELSKTMVKKRKYTKRVKNDSSMDNMELRRTSRKIILRVNEDFIGTKFIKMARKKKFKESTPISTKFIKMARKKKCKESTPISSNLNSLNYPGEVVVKRGRGRPRKPKQIPGPPENSVKAEDGAVWTLVPKKIIDSEFFKSQILQVHYPHETSRSTNHVFPPPKPFPSLKYPLQNKDNFDARNALIPNENSHQFQENQYYNSNDNSHQFQEKKFYNCSPRRPTVIYFKQPKNFSNRVTPDTKGVRDNANRDFETSGGYLANKAWKINYLLRKYKNEIEKSEIEYAFGVSGGNLQKTEELLSDVLFRKKSSPDNSSQFNVVDSGFLSQAQIFQANENDRSINQRSLISPIITNSYTIDSKTLDDVPDTLCRQVIVDSIKLLYDEDSVLGCF